MALTGGAPQGKGGEFKDINVTPLVDVMLVLLVVFMVTAPLLATGLRVELPEVRAQQTPLRDTKLIVSITREERIVFRERDVTDSIEQRLLDDGLVRREKELYIRADSQARYAVVARVLAAARAAGIEGLNLLVQPEEPAAPAGKRSPRPSP